MSAADKDKDKGILDRIRKRRDFAYEYFNDYRTKALEDLKFCNPENQWPDAEKAKRKQQGRPCLTIDRTNPFIDQLVNDERQNRPAIKTSPINDGADEDIADIYQGYIRHVERTSNADYAYDRASEAQKRCGFGFMRLGTDYIDEDTFDQDIKILSVPNPFMYYIDPESTEPDGSDAKWGFCEGDIVRETFKEQYPDAMLAEASSSDWKSVGDDAPGWVSADGKSLRIVEYYELDHMPITLCLLDGNKSVPKDKVPKGTKILKERQSNKITLKWYKVCANQILDRRDCPGKYIPIVPVYGKEMIINNERDYLGIVRGMKDVQRMIHVWKSAQTEAIGLAPRAPWIVALGALPACDKTWSTANTTNYSALFYNAWDTDGRQMPPPTRNVQEPAIQAITVALQGTEEDLKAVTGLYDPSRGLSDNANQSGIAIKSLQRQGLTSNFHFTDNFNRSLRHLGRILISWIPQIVDSERLIRIIGPDGAEKLVRVNTSEPVPHHNGTGQPRIYDMTIGKYDVDVDSGPSYATKRQENADALTNLAKMLPTVQQLGADILVRQLDFPEAKELAERVQPPQFKKQNENQPQIPPEVQQQIQHQMQMIQLLTSELHAVHDQFDKDRAELELKKYIAELNAKTQVEVARAKIASGDMQAVLDHDLTATMAEADRSQEIFEQMMNSDQNSAGGSPAGANGAQMSAGATAGTEEV